MISQASFELVLANGKSLLLLMAVADSDGPRNIFRRPLNQRDEARRRVRDIVDRSQAIIDKRRRPEAEREMGCPSFSWTRLPTSNTPTVSRNKRSRTAGC